MENLKRLRKAKNLTQKELGELCDVSESMIGLVENGNRKPSYELLLKLGEALDCSVDDLLRGTKNPALNEEDGLTDVQREFKEVYPTMTDQEISVLLSTAKALIASRRSQDDSSPA